MQGYWASAFSELHHHVHKVQVLCIDYMVVVVVQRGTQSFQKISSVNCASRILLRLQEVKNDPLCNRGFNGAAWDVQSLGYFYDDQTLGELLFFFFF